MSRRMDREGIARHIPQGIANARWQAELKASGRTDDWWSPLTMIDGLRELNSAIWWLRYRLLVVTPYSDYERADVIRRVKLLLGYSARCPKPALPHRRNSGGSVPSC